MLLIPVQLSAYFGASRSLKFSGFFVAGHSRDHAMGGNGIFYLMVAITGFQ
jgi:hypothetical protein